MTPDFDLLTHYSDKVALVRQLIRSMAASLRTAEITIATFRHYFENNTNVGEHLEPLAEAFRQQTEKLASEILDKDLADEVRTFALPTASNWHHRQISRQYRERRESLAMPRTLKTRKKRREYVLFGTAKASSRMGIVVQGRPALVTRALSVIEDNLVRDEKARVIRLIDGTAPFSTDERKVRCASNWNNALVSGPLLRKLVADSSGKEPFEALIIDDLSRLPSGPTLRTQRLSLDPAERANTVFRRAAEITKGHAAVLIGGLFEREQEPFEHRHMMNLREVCQRYSVYEDDGLLRVMDDYGYDFVLAEEPVLTAA